MITRHTREYVSYEFPAKIGNRNIFVYIDRILRYDLRPIFETYLLLDLIEIV